MKKIFRTLLVLLIPLVAHAHELSVKSCKQNPFDAFFDRWENRFENKCGAPTNLMFFTNRDDVVVHCGASNVSVDAGSGADIVAVCSRGVDAIKIVNGRAYIDLSTEGTADYDVEGTNGDDIIVVCREGVTVNSLGGNDTIVECPNENTVFIF